LKSDVTSDDYLDSMLVIAKLRHCFHLLLSHIGIDSVEKDLGQYEAGFADRLQYNVEALARR
jgi:hypothetical protein